MLVFIEIKRTRNTNYNSEMAEIEDLSSEIRAFAEARDWGQFHTLRNLMLALVGEVGELAAEVQWVPDDQIEEHLNDPAKRADFESEIADVATYLLRICDITGVDIAHVIREKIIINENRYPASIAKGSAVKYNKWGTK